jgi:hypothetical protein
MSSSPLSANRSNPLISTVAMLVGAVFVLVGILGFVPGITTHYGDLQFMGHDSSAKLIGLFEVSILHNIVHLLFGVAGIAAARASASAARSYLVGGGVIYLVLWVYGLVIGMDSKANFVPVNNADNWLHLLLGIGMVGLGLALGRTVSSTTSTSGAVR